MVTVNGISPIFHLSGTVKIESVQCVVLSPIRQRGNDLKGRSRRVLPLRCPIYQTGIIFISGNRLPVCRQRVRIKVRFAHHCQNLSRIRFHNYHGALMIAQSVISRLLQFNVQCRYDGIAMIFFILKFIFHLFQHISMGS